MRPQCPARIVFKVDVRRKEPLLAALVSQEPVRHSLGEVSFSLAIDDSARHIGYVTLEWESFKSARRFFDSEQSRSLVAEWPLTELLEVLVFKDITSDYMAYRSAQQLKEAE